MKRIVSLIFVVMAIAAAAQERPAQTAWTIGAGSSSVTDTYLSPEAYRGWAVSLGYERYQAMKFNPRQWVMRLSVDATACRARNTAGNAAMWDGSIAAGWGMMRRWRVSAVEGLRLAAGGSTGIDIGAGYLSRNGNNPVNARAAWTLNLTGYAAWTVRLGRMPVTLRYQPTIPVLGAFFCPEYGELYYEIWLDNRSGLAHFAWPGNRFAMDNALTADLRFGATSLRLGYRGGILSQAANNLTLNRFTHMFTLGVVCDFISVDLRRDNSEKIIPAL